MHNRDLHAGITPGETGQQLPLIGPIEAPGLHVMSWNIRRIMPGFTVRAADRWETRAAGVQRLLQSEQPSLLGVQEALAEQREFVGAALGEKYRCVGHGRNADGGGESGPLFYDASRLELLHWEQQALSSDPQRPGSKSWGNLIPRILVAATFQDRVSLKPFLAINTHFDHVSRTSRLLSARAILQLVAKTGLPAVIMGDLNAGATSAPLRELLHEGKLVDSWAAAASHSSKEWGTFANYQEPQLGRKRIDWILLTPQVEVLQAAINPHRYKGGWASDHLPVQGVLHFPAGSGKP